MDGLLLEAFAYVLRSDLFLVEDEVLVEQLGSLCLFLVPGGEEVLMELELLCLEFIAKELRRLLVLGG